MKAPDVFSLVQYACEEVVPGTRGGASLKEHTTESKGRRLVCQVMTSRVLEPAQVLTSLVSAQYSGKEVLSGPHGGAPICK